MASKSPRRRELMRLVTPCFEVDEADVDEAAFLADTPAALAEKLAVAKAEAVFAMRPADVVIGCDTVVQLRDDVLGKPRNVADAEYMLAALQNNCHQVHTGVCVFVPGRQEPAALFAETTQVHFAPVPRGEIQRYVATDEPYDKAGGYGVQGWAARFITRIEGCYYNVMGLPVSALYHRLAALGLV